MQITILQVPYEKNIGVLVSETMKQQWLSTCFVMWSAYCLLEAEQFQLSHERNLPHAHSRTHLKLFIRMYPPLKHIWEANECLTNTGNVSWAHTHNKPCHMNDSQVKAFYAWCVATELFIPLLCSFLTSRLRKTTLTYLNKGSQGSLFIKCQPWFLPFSWVSRKKWYPSCHFALKFLW